jgi:phenylacetate-coenzyme A ligase PaaK-like adenylate-forming protein
MNDNLLRIYNRLPGPARSLAVSLRGQSLKRWRYSEETDRLVEAALERESWTAARWTSWQEERLAYVLHRAAVHVPYYREQWHRRRRHGDRASWEVLENWPTLDKDSVRQNPRAFVADDCDPRRMFHDHTSGTTGKPLDLWQSQETTCQWYALFEARARRWYGVSREDRWAILGGQLVTPVSQRHPPFWVWNAALKQVYMSSYHLAPDLVPHYLNAILRYRVTYLLGYTSALYALAQEVIRLKRTDLRLAVVITNAEPVFEYQRAVISEAFQCPVRETYGMAEIVFAASECASGRLHIWPETGVGKVTQENEAVENGKAGDLICTGLMNTDMPLIRYRVGDRAALPSVQSDCKCGRSLPQMSFVEGRADDVLYTADGRRIGRLDPVFKGQLPIREAQIVQESLNSLRLRFVPGPEYTDEDGQTMVRNIKQRMGSVEVILEAVATIPRSANGKFRSVICNLPQNGGSS